MRVGLHQARDHGEVGNFWFDDSAPRRLDGWPLLFFSRGHLLLVVYREFLQAEVAKKIAHRLARPEQFRFSDYIASDDVIARQL